MKKICYTHASGDLSVLIETEQAGFVAEAADLDSFLEL